MGFLDDSVLFRDNFDECKTGVSGDVNLLQILGFQVHPEKSSLTPKQK